MEIRFLGCNEDSFYGVPFGRYGDRFRGMTDNSSFFALTASRSRL